MRLGRRDLGRRDFVKLAAGALPLLSRGALAQLAPSIRPPSPAERGAMARLSRAFMNKYDVPALSTPKASASTGPTIGGTGSLPGTSTIAVRTHGGFCWAAFTNTRRGNSNMDGDLDNLNWTMARQVGEWRVA